MRPDYIATKIGLILPDDLTAMLCEISELALKCHVEFTRNDSDQSRIQEMRRQMKEICLIVTKKFSREMPYLSEGVSFRFANGTMSIHWTPEPRYGVHHHGFQLLPADYLYDLMETENGQIRRHGILRLSYSPKCLHGLEGDQHGCEKCIGYGDSIGVIETVSTAIRPKGLPRWRRPSLKERLFGLRGGVSRYVRVTPGGVQSDWCIRHTFAENGTDMEGFLFKFDQWLEADVPPAEAERNHPARRLYQGLDEPQDGPSPIYPDLAIFTTEAAEQKAFALKQGWIRMHKWRLIELGIGLMGVILSLVALVLALTD